MSRYKLIIFDLDGTIADTSPGILNSIRYTQKKMNLPEISLEKMYSHVGPPMEESYHNNFGLEGEALKQAVAFHKEYAVKNGYRELVLYDGMLECLKKLEAAGYLMAVATLKSQGTAVKIFESLGIADKFAVIAGTVPEKHMTKSMLLESCMEKTGVEKAQTVLVGDSSYDAIGAKEANVDFIGATYGFGFKNGEDVDNYPNIGHIIEPLGVLKLLGNTI